MKKTNLMAAVSLLATVAAAPAAAQDAEPKSSTATPSPTPGAATTPQTQDQPDGLADIVVTGTKRIGTISVQKAPLAVTAFGTDALNSGHVAEIADLTGKIPNVFLNTSETIHGVNNFSIRGMAVYDTIPSNTPTVGIFSDGIYVGASAASALSTFDNESIEVLRGPQGLLFGRNVTAGAILVNSSLPTSRFTIRAQAAIESGPNFTESLVVSGPLTSDKELRGKIAVYRNDDEGYFTNLFNGRDFGKSRTTVLRAALSYQPSADFTAIARYEYGKSDGDGPASQNHGVYSDDGFGFSINEPGYAHNRWNQAILDTRLKTGFGNGEIVNILGYRDVSSDGLFDADSTPSTFFHFGTAIRQHQWSDELRYSGTFGPVTPTVGIYYYGDVLDYVEDRVLAATAIAGGGYQKSTTYAIFSNFDVALGSKFILTLGARYSEETKNARVRGLVARGASTCSLTAASCTTFNFTDSHTWGAFTPKIGLQWNPDSDTNVYAYWTKGFRSGGYNLRQTNLLAPPGPYDQEVENSYEIGLKKDMLGRRLRINVAAFQNDYKALQRAIFQSSPTIGIAQTTVNSADTRIRGIEGEVTARPVNGLTLGGHFGYLQNDWKQIYFHLSGAGPVTPAGYALELPFLSPWSYGANLDYRTETSLGTVSFNLSFDHRDRTPSNDANTGFLKAVNRIDANLGLKLSNGFSVALYGKNLTNQATTGLNNPLTFTPGETIAPLNKGRILGIELRFSN